MENLLETLLVLVTIFIFIQVATMVGILVFLRKLGGNLTCLQRLVEQEAKPAVTEVREAIGEAKEVIKIARGAAENLTGVTDTVRLQVEQVNSIIQETTDKVHLRQTKTKVRPPFAPLRAGSGSDFNAKLRFFQNQTGGEIPSIGKK